MRKKAKKGVMYFIGIVCQLWTDIETDTTQQYFLQLSGEYSVLKSLKSAI